MKVKTDDGKWWQDLSTGALVRERPGHYSIRLPGTQEFVMVPRQDGMASEHADIISRYVTYTKNRGRES